MGCDYAQGFLFSPALSPDDVTQWLHDRQTNEPRRRLAPTPPTSHRFPAVA